MQRTRSLHALFLGLLSGCTSGPGTTSTIASDSLDSSCSNTDYQEEYEVPVSQVEPFVDVDGMVLPEHCYMLCTEQSWGDVLGCTLLDPVMPPATSGDGMTSGQASTSAEGTGGSSVGDGSTGGDPTGTTGGEDPTGSTGAVTMGSTGMEETVTLRCEFQEYCLGGRGHEALRSRPTASGEDRLGRWLAATAHSEAASVVAFLAMADELAAHGAPEDLVRRAREAAQDEVAHARTMTRLALARGASVQAPSFGTIEIRDLTAIALENAAEGCVRETWAALEAAHQARTATDPELRQVMTRIAADEARHAELSHDLDAWIRTRLADETVARVDAARRRAARELLEGMQGERDPKLCALAGLPAAATARRLCEGLARQLWA
jgi:rubrerythrin